MEIGDFAYLIILGIFWVFNVLRKRQQKQVAEVEEQREAAEAAERQAKSSAKPVVDRRNPPPQDPMKRVLEELFGQPAADTTTRTPPLQPLPKARPVNRPNPQQSWEDAKSADGRSRAGSKRIPPIRMAVGAPEATRKERALPRSESP